MAETKGKYHISADGQPRRCIATIQCRLTSGNNENSEVGEHYDTVAEAYTAYERSMETQVPATFTKASKNTPLLSSMSEEEIEETARYAAPDNIRKLKSAIRLFKYPHESQNRKFGADFGYESPILKAADGDGRTRREMHELLKVEEEKHIKARETFFAIQAEIKTSDASNRIQSAAFPEIDLYPKEKLEEMEIIASIAEKGDLDDLETIAKSRRDKSRIDSIKSIKKFEKKMAVERKNMFGSSNRQKIVSATRALDDYRSARDREVVNIEGFKDQLKDEFEIALYSNEYTGAM